MRKLLSFRDQVPTFKINNIFYKVFHNTDALEPAGADPAPVSRRGGGTGESYMIPPKTVGVLIYELLSIYSDIYLTDETTKKVVFCHIVFYYGVHYEDY